ncbi:MAG: exodeoxyribonuclease V subunit beta [Candidatus Dasytiphilus stammeri]
MIYISNINWKPKSLDPLRLPLYGEVLIEASAGTGKTSTISILYLRLLLGLRCDRKNFRALSVDEILVVTFTEAATAELRRRIRSDIYELRIACVLGISKNNQINQLLVHIKDLVKASAILLNAELNMESAAIFTIHSFCQRMLYLNAMESQILFEPKIIEDDFQLWKRMIGEFWHNYLSPLPINIAREILNEWSGPDALLKTLLPLLQGDKPVLKYPLVTNLTLQEQHQKIIHQISLLKEKWLLFVSDLSKLMINSNLDRRTYNIHRLSLWIKNISRWAQDNTESYLFPKDLQYFSKKKLLQKINYGEIPDHPIFKYIDNFISNPPSILLREWVIVRALQESTKAIINEKQLHCILGFDDLLNSLEKILLESAGSGLSHEIRSRYPVTLIDEFQDTDSKQYSIFKKIYLKHSKETALLLIGDPKQAIYSFRGADIFNYMSVRANIVRHYTLNINWRSSPNLISSVNQIFSTIKYPFLFPEIPFLPVKPAPSERAFSFTINNKPQTALRFFLHSVQCVDTSEYYKIMAIQCAKDIKRLIIAVKNQSALLINSKITRKLKTEDIVILVRNRNEAMIMRNTLNTLNINSVYLSNQPSIYNTPEAHDILLLLKAILNPKSLTLLRSALATSIFGLEHHVLENLNKINYSLDYFAKKFFNYKKTWSKYGVLTVLRQVMANHITENILLSENGKQRLIYISHISDLLQEASFKLNSEYALVRWLEQQIAQSSHQKKSHPVPLEEDRNVVQILSIHKAKGLEYPIVWLPFLINFRKATHSIYHDRKTFIKILDLHNDKESQKLADEERLAEDLRLLYVALTRAIWHCNIGIAPLIKGHGNKKGNSELHLSALGYLLQKGKENNAQELEIILNKMQNEAIEIIPVYNNTCSMIPLSKNCSKITVSINREPKVYLSYNTNYKLLQRYSNYWYHSRFIKFPYLDFHRLMKDNNDVDSKDELLSRHTFPCGKITEIFFQKLLKFINFNQPIQQQFTIKEHIDKYGFARDWIPVIHNWLEEILHTLLDDDLSLNKLSKNHQLVELKFLLPINKYLSIDKLDNLIKSYDPLSAMAHYHSFNYIKEIISGCIDLVLLWKGKYYIINYQSNWLGRNTSSYTHQAMANFIISNRYDLQYHLYSLALYRYLRQRLDHYDYNLNFGGVYYIFLRGISAVKDIKNHTGIFQVKPNIACIQSLDKIFS